ncbi:MAG: hypothetical protein PHS45_03665 [Bacilli bacterium]|nr:hypothetical protein [Bacilli bacterium]
MLKKKVMSLFLTICVAAGIYTGHRLVRKHSLGETPTIETEMDIKPIYIYRYKYLNANGEWSEFSPWLDFKPSESSLRYIESKIIGYEMVPKKEDGGIGDQSRNKPYNKSSDEDCGKLNDYNSNIKRLYITPNKGIRNC